MIGLLALEMTACGKASSEVSVPDEPVAASSQNDSKEESDDTQSEATEEEIPEEEYVSNADPSVDIDLTSLSSTFIYSEVFNMVMSPDEYLGMKVKMEGTCGTYQDENTGKMYYACIIKDATQCCSQGLEFVLDESKYSPNDYPAQGDNIVVAGIFSTYEENGKQYITMLDSELMSE